MVERLGPLLTLANKLCEMAPCSLSALKITIFPSEDQLFFMNLVEEYLPERAKEIFKLNTPSKQTAKFASYFEDRYFPLAEFLQDLEDDAYAWITQGIPLIVQGISWDWYEQIPEGDNPGEIIVTYLVSCGYDEQGSRVTLAEACAKRIPQYLLEMVPEGGLSSKDAHRLFDKTPFKGIAIWADILNGETGNYFLDTDDEYYSRSGPPEWSMENVKGLTRLWKESELKHRIATDLWGLIDKTPVETFREILHIMFPERGVIIDKNQLKLDLKFDPEKVEKEKGEAAPAEVQVGDAGGPGNTP